MPVDAGPPTGGHEKSAYKRNPYVKETALPEPQMIKQTVLWRFFECCRILSKLNRFRHMDGKRTIPGKLEYELQENVEWLCLFLSNKPNVQEWENKTPSGEGEWKNFNDLKVKIIGGQIFSHAELCGLVFRIADALQELGITKIEYLKTVKPEYAYFEGDILGDY